MFRKFLPCDLTHSISPGNSGKYNSFTDISSVFIKASTIKVSSWVNFNRYLKQLAIHQEDAVFLRASTTSCNHELFTGLMASWWVNVVQFPWTGPFFPDYSKRKWAKNRSLNRFIVTLLEKRKDWAKLPLFTFLKEYIMSRFYSRSQKCTLQEQLNCNSFPLHFYFSRKF